MAGSYQSFVPESEAVSRGRRANIRARPLLIERGPEGQLVDWTGRIIGGDKRGYIDNDLPLILDRLQIPLDQWNQNTTQYEAIHKRRFNRPRLRTDTG